MYQKYDTYIHESEKNLLVSASANSRIAAKFDSRIKQLESVLIYENLSSLNNPIW